MLAKVNSSSEGQTLDQPGVARRDVFNTSLIIHCIVVGGKHEQWIVVRMLGRMMRSTGVLRR